MTPFTDKWKVAAVFLLALAALGIGVERIRIASAFTDPVSAIRAQDESTYAHSALHMARSGGWMTPQFLGRLYIQKPPLLMWLTALSLKWFGISLLSIRMPVLLAAALAVALVFSWVRHTRSAGVAAAAAILLASDSLWHRYARICQTDAMVAAWIVAAVFCLAQDPQLAGRISFLCFGVFTAAALMTKNIAGLLPLCILLVFRILTRGDQRPALGRIFQACLIAASLALPWHIYQLLVHRRWFWAEYVGVQILGFGVHPPSQISDEGAFVFYLKRLALTDPVLLLFVLLALPAFWAALRVRDNARPMVLLSWLLVSGAALIGFRYRNLQYVASLVPALCILGAMYSPLLSRGNGGVARPLTGSGVTIAGLCAVFFVKAWFWSQPFGLPFFRETLFPSEDALRAYSDRGRPNELIVVSPDDDFYSAVLPLPHVRYCFLDTLSHMEGYGPHLVHLGITVTAAQFVELDRWQGPFLTRLREWGIDSAEPVATAIVASSDREVRSIIQARPESDFFLPIEMQDMARGAVQSTHDLAAATPQRFFLLAQRTPIQPGPRVRWTPPRHW